MERNALTGIARGSMLAGIAFASSGLGAVHGIAHPAGSIMGIPHGVCCAVLLPAVLQYNLPACREKFAELAAGLDFASPEELISEVIRLRRELALPENFTSFGFKEEYIPFIVKNCRSGSMRCKYILRGTQCSLPGERITFARQETFQRLGQSVKSA